MTYKPRLASLCSIILSDIFSKLFIEHRLFLFSGEMGSGKTTLIGRLVLDLLKANDGFSSPTYAYMNKYILENTNWRITNKDLLIKCTLINNNHIIYNPDTYYVKNNFMFLDNEKYYYGKIIFNNKKVIDTIWFQVCEQKDKINLYVDINFNKIDSLLDGIFYCIEMKDYSQVYENLRIYLRDRCVMLLDKKEKTKKYI
mgnify:CR=1 FL=1